ncbi:hypothetical protein SAICODRAFT_30828 [Saitoella complicata NRRL Y-17804]|nr:uncharacterized protein SAICODRAFT_30828 [Saitoella complicata NRRL Y-17804]ODQ52404.1 hypothetical protein SAICODRAFT_30828 [Saitoella complicata NRRL Y-17804]
MFSFTRVLRNAEHIATTGITGLAAVAKPRPVLLEHYKNTLAALSELPSHAVYRQATEALTKHRQSIVEATESADEIEQKIGAGLIEEVILQAETELSLAKKMKEWKPWEALEEPAPKGQWEYFEKK